MAERSRYQLGSDSLIRIDPKDLPKIAETADAEVITMIFSLEHVYDLHAFMTSLRRNKTLRYFFFAVPMFSPSVFIDLAFPHFAPRVLGLGHTHFFSNRSIEVLCQRFGMKRLAEWWFGGNAFDLIRNIAVTLNQNPGMESATAAWIDQMSKVMDGVQLAFDHEKLSSEIHLLAGVEK